MAASRRFVYGPRGLGALLPDITRPVFRKHNPAWAMMLTDWEAIVGPRIAAMTAPRRLDRGLLTIACAGPVAMALHYEGVELINRINTYLGGQPVQSLRFTQAAVPRKPRPAAKPPPEAAAEAEAAIGDFPDGELRAALTSLGRVVLGRVPPGHSKHSTRRMKKQ
ncbi:hypothetical protein CCS01_11615 [Rhodopila globiformis]|uniref:DUF721 domain-containing protein n=2 Tax=Rhodopila globiformis TaxID=1071 RepID=A0A2S6NI41_RHOGL|nr:hypothetical protein CCS01_11615 [Rhodopila globiformis]